MKALTSGMIIILKVIFKTLAYVFRVTPQPQTSSERRKQYIADAYTQGFERFIYGITLIIMFVNL
jgi:hypothetical protein